MPRRGVPAAGSKKGRFAATLVAAFTLLLATIAVAPSAYADPYIGPGGEPKVEGVSGPWKKMDRPRGEESRGYLPGCPKAYVCLYVLSNQTSARNYWYIFRLYEERSYKVYDFNYNSSLQWIINNQIGGVDAMTFDGGVIGDLIACYDAPAIASETSWAFKSANWYPVWWVATDGDCNA
ncbi:hypothetical protein [Spirillospora sp. CA-128828]|uniref:hypothetical protein n=1 Tax=Spirillospora sp. CA-128828 TaxID=3240033 RepID=UPI003D920F8E